MVRPEEPIVYMRTGYASRSRPKSAGLAVNRLSGCNLRRSENFLCPDKPFVPLAVALRSMLAETEAKFATAAPAEKARLQERAEVLREWIKLKPTTPVST
jgi:hypothetical protein